MQRNPTLFISYSWQTKKIADRIATDLEVIGVSVIKDNNELQFTDNIPNFMKRIRSCDFALLLISDSYLKSKNCLYEILELQKDNNHWEKVLPIVCKDTKIYSSIERIDYIKFWEQKIKELQTALKNINPINSSELYKELKLFQDIAYNIDSFLKKISDSLHYDPEELISKRYKPIIDKLNVDNHFDSLKSLMNIYLINDLEKREIELEEYRQNNKESGYYYSIKGSTARDLFKYEQAIYFYEQGLKLDPENFAILNNYGQLEEKVKRNYQKAKELYEKAVKSNPESEIARLNLGVLLGSQFNDSQGAREQYEEILKFNPLSEKAHNNLGSLYKKPAATKSDIENAEFHFKKALEINPDYMDALLNYGNLLKAFRKKFKKGNSYYLKAKKLDKEGNLTEMLDMMIKSKKG
jgi:tetratricopeptide (TPR) repeat protein